MSGITYQGLCLGGPLAGQILGTNKGPVLRAMDGTEYLYVTMVGLRGFWLHENETHGTQPFDDIFRLLTESYILTKGDNQNGTNVGRILSPHQGH